MLYERAGLLISSTSSAFLELDLMGLMQNMLLIPRDAPPEPLPATMGSGANRATLGESLGM